LHFNPLPAITPTSAQCPPTLPLFHPAAILREWSLRHVTVHDLRMRVPRAFDGEWNPGLKAILLQGLHLSTVMTHLEWWIKDASVEPLTLGLDVETRASTFITCLGLGTESQVLSIPFVDITASRGF